MPSFRFPQVVQQPVEQIVEQVVQARKQKQHQYKLLTRNLFAMQGLALLSVFAFVPKVPQVIEQKRVQHRSIEQIASWTCWMFFPESVAKGSRL